VQLPQVPLQPSSPQFFPVQFGVHTVHLWVVESQVCGAVQLPQLSVPPQPSLAEPQV
jgi:hypothetical protein